MLLFHRFATAYCHSICQKRLIQTLITNYHCLSTFEQQTACHVMSFHVMSYHLMSSHLELHPRWLGASHHCSPSHIMSSHVMSCHVMSSSHVLSNLISSPPLLAGHNRRGHLLSFCRGLAVPPRCGSEMRRDEIEIIKDEMRMRGDEKRRNDIGDEMR